ncbi:MAG: cytochrome c-type biogenesis protein CcmH [Polyangia bacterium]|nr:cytochrome c-type biogenesis protein CcmH [Polyangia bacterium]
MRLLFPILASLLLGSAAPRAAPVAEANVERRAKAIERLLTAPCCYKGTLEDHASVQASQMRKEIRTFLSEGKSRAQILSYYRQKYGQAVLVEPPRGGLSTFVLYGIPFGLAVLGIVVMTALLTRRREAEPDRKEGLGSEVGSLPQEMEARIDELVEGRERSRE